LVRKDLQSNQSGAAEGNTTTIPQVASETLAPFKIDEPTFIMELPHDWHEIERKSTRQENSITWQATKTGGDNRWLSVYIDRIPADIAVNRLLPVMPENDQLRFGGLSDNC